MTEKENNEAHEEAYEFLGRTIEFSPWVGCTLTQWTLQPKDDITVQELAAVIGLMRIVVSDDILNTLPESARRHFVGNEG